MNFLQKHEFLFGALFALFLAPLLLQFFGIIHVLDVDKDTLALPFMAILAVIPALIWIKIFNAENPETKTALLFAFLAGCTSTIPVFFYQKLFQSGEIGNFIFFKAEAVNFQHNIADIFGYQSLGALTSSAGNGTITAIIGVFFVFMGVGALEEIVKHVVVNKKAVIYLAFFAAIVGGSYIASSFSLFTAISALGLLALYFIFLRFLTKFIQFQSIDDVIEVAIVAALGFAFVENVHYFMGKLGAISTGTFIFFVLVRVTVVTVVHVLCSGIMAYHVGLAHFAHPVLQDEIKEGRKFRFIAFMHKFFDVPAEKIFKYEQIWIGVLLAILVHACYDFFMQLQYNVFGFIPLFALIMPIYFIGGIWYLFTLLERKEDHKKFGKVIEKEEYVSV